MSEPTRRLPRRKRPRIDHGPVNAPPVPTDVAAEAAEPVTAPLAVTLDLITEIVENTSVAAHLANLHGFQQRPAWRAQHAIEVEVEFGSTMATVTQGTTPGAIP